MLSLTRKGIPRAGAGRSVKMSRKVLLSEGAGAISALATDKKDADRGIRGYRGRQ